MTPYPGPAIVCFNMFHDGDFSCFRHGRMLGTRPVMDWKHLAGSWIQLLTILCALSLAPSWCDSSLTCSPGIDYGGKSFSPSSRSTLGYLTA